MSVIKWEIDPKCCVELKVLRRNLKKSLCNAGSPQFLPLNLTTLTTQITRKASQSDFFSTQGKNAHKC